MDQTQDNTVSSSDLDDRRGLLKADKALLEKLKSTGTDIDALRGAMKCLEETLDKLGETVREEDALEAKYLRLEATTTLNMLSTEAVDLKVVVAYFQIWVDRLGDGDRRKPSVLHLLGVFL